MSLSNLAKSSRATLYFSVQNISAREELLLKSVLRLLDHRCEQAWAYQPGTGGPGADLVIAGEGTPPKLNLSGRGMPQHLLVLGISAQASRPAFLRMPLRADELEAELNRLGGLICQQLAAGASKAPGADRPAAPNAPAPTSLESKQLDGAAQQAPIKLLRWPSANLITTRDRMRLATLMTGQPITLVALAARSGVAIEVCREFASDLGKAGFLGTGDHTAPAPQSTSAELSKPAAVATTGLLSRIRTRLGLHLFGR